MSRHLFRTSLLVVGVAVLSAGGTYWWTQSQHRATAASADPMAMQPAASEKKALYWYDPMVPSQHFDKPGKSPFMDMQLVPKYADGGDANNGASSGLKIDSRLTQNLGMRLAPVEQGTFSQTVQAAASVAFNERDIAIVQTRTSGFVQRVYARAPGDVIAKDAPLVDILVPDWAGAQAEFIALSQSGDKGLVRAARERLQLLGMPESLIEHLERSGQVHTTITLSAPIAGVIQSLELRQGMTVSGGMTVATLNGIGTVWLEAAVPETQGDLITIGQAVNASVAAVPGKVIKGRVLAVLPEINAQARTLRVRMEFPNPKGLLRPGMFAQVQFASGARPNSLMVPSEAVIRTGKRNIVMLAQDGGRFAPMEVELGPEANGKTVILNGLQAGQKVVASGQFLIDSEASLNGVAVQPLPPAESAKSVSKSAAMPAGPGIQGQGVIEAIGNGQITISHQPIPAISWPAMTMAFAMTKAVSVTSLKPGQHIRFGLEKHGDDFVVNHVDATPVNATGDQ
jgi:Cu(I)/Ag(I) efflux system membrane fusion protein